MISGDEYGVDLDIAFRLADGNKKTLLENLKLFVSLYRDTSMLRAKLFGDNVKAVTEKIEYLKGDARLAGAFLVYQTCTEMLEKEEIEPRDVNVLCGYIDRAIEFIEEYVFSDFDEADEPERTLSELCFALRLGLKENSRLLAKRLLQSERDDVKRRILLKISDATERGELDEALSLLVKNKMKNKSRG